MRIEGHTGIYAGENGRLTIGDLTPGMTAAEARQVIEDYSRRCRQAGITPGNVYVARLSIEPVVAGATTPEASSAVDAGPVTTGAGACPPRRPRLFIEILENEHGIAVGLRGQETATDTERMIGMMLMRKYHELLQECGADQGEIQIEMGEGDGPSAEDAIRQYRQRRQN